MYKKQNAQFKVKSSDSISQYQWQIDTKGNGFENLTNTNQFQGVNTETLTILETTLLNNNQKFRCNIFSECSLTSNIAILTVLDTTTIDTNKVNTINTIDLEQLINISPNPSKSNLRIKVNKSLIDESFTIYNSIGILLFNSVFTESELNIDISKFNRGIYFLEIIGHSELKQKLFFE